MLARCDILFQITGTLLHSKIFIACDIIAGKSVLQLYEMEICKNRKLRVYISYTRFTVYHIDAIAYSNANTNTRKAGDLSKVLTSSWLCILIKSNMFVCFNWAHYFSSFFALTNSCLRSTFSSKVIVSWLFVHGHLSHSSLTIIFYRIWTEYYFKTLEN